MEYFFYTEKDLPGGVGIPLFGSEHRIWLGLSLIVLAAVCLTARHLTERKLTVLRRALCVSIFSSELLRFSMMLHAGYPIVEVLPLHMCGLSIFVILWHVLTGSELAAELMYCLGMPGALSALLFPNWLNYPVYSLLSINSVFAHIIITGYALVLISSGILSPQVRRLPRCAACLAGVAVPIYVFNKLTGMNYFFLNWPSEGSPLLIFGDLLGNPGYLLGFIPMLTAVWLVLYLPIVIAKRKKGKKTHG